MHGRLKALPFSIRYTSLASLFLVFSLLREAEAAAESGLNFTERQTHDT